MGKNDEVIVLDQLTSLNRLRRSDHIHSTAKHTPPGTKQHYRGTWPLKNTWTSDVEKEM